jgi:thiamine-phosphate pyrophosphorylase
MSNEPRHSVYRILDSSANRAGEGLRTLEEFARFVLDDPSQCQAWKELRHDLAASLQRFARVELLRARDTVADVGTQIRVDSEYQRADLAAVVAAAATRVQQSLRTLEEYGKTIDPQAAAEFEQQRYRCYTLAASLELGVVPNLRRQRLQDSCLYALIDCDHDELSFADNLATLAQAGIDLFQLRDRAATDHTLFTRACLGSTVARQHGALFIVNDRPDIAVAADADGVHVGQDELPASQVRQIVGTQRLIGVSTHSSEQAQVAVAAGADYLGCGPVFPGRTKQFTSYPGIEFLFWIANQISLPAFAIGGIDRSNVDQVIQAGIRRIAVTGAIRDAEHPSAAAQELKTRLTSNC